MSKVLSDKEQKIFDFVNSQVKQRGYPPSVREICLGVGIKSTSTVHSYLEKLSNYGLIEKDPTKPRTLKILNESRSTNQFEKGDVVLENEICSIPIVGKVTAGAPILAVENIEGNFTLPASFVGSVNSFILKVKGDSMIEAGIFDGDYIVVRQQPNAINGDIVVALLDDEATVKTFYKESNHIRLQPENSLLDPIIVKDNISILGKVTGVLRKI
jgi:repressor LexA